MIKIKSPDLFFAIEKVAEFLSVNPVTIRRAIFSGKLQAFKVGKQYRIEKQDLEKYFASIATSPLAEDKIIEITTLKNP